MKVHSMLAKDTMFLGLLGAGHNLPVIGPFNDQNQSDLGAKQSERRQENALESPAVGQFVQDPNVRDHVLLTFMPGSMAHHCVHWWTVEPLFHSLARDCSSTHH